MCWYELEIHGFLQIEEPSEGHCARRLEMKRSFLPEMDQIKRAPEGPTESLRQKE